MPATKRKHKSHKPRKKAAKRKPAAKTTTRHATGHCKGECRLRTKGMKVGDVRRRISRDGKKLKVIRVG